MKNLIALLSCALCIFVLCDFAQAQPAASGWPMFHGNAQRTGRGTVAGPSTPVFRWSYTITPSSTLNSSVAVGPDGKTFVGAHDNALYAFDSQGAVAWTYVLNNHVGSCPAVDSSGTIYTSSFTTFYALLSDGSSSWTYYTGAFAGSPALGSDGTVYNSGGNNIYAMTTAGQVFWSYETADSIYSSPSLGQGGQVYCGSLDNYFYALASSGTFAWSYYAQRVRAIPSIGPGGRIYAGTEIGSPTLFAFNTNGALAWSYVGGGDFYSSSPVIGSDGTVFAGSEDTSLYALRSNGSLGWSYRGGSAFDSSAALGSDGVMYIGCSNSRLYALTTNGSFLWSYRAGASFDSCSPALGPDGSVHVANLDHHIYVFQGPPTATPTATPTVTPTFPPPTATPVPPTATPIPTAQMDLNGSSFNTGDFFTATFVLNLPIERSFTVFAVVIMPDGFMLDAITLGPSIKPLASNVPRLDAPFSYPLISLNLPAGAPPGQYEVVAAFFDPSKPITGRADAFLDVSSKFVIQ